MQPAGTGTALGTANGATGTFNGTVYTFTANVGWIAANNVGTFNAFKETQGGYDALTRWDIGGVPTTVGTHSCKTSGSLPVVTLGTGGGTIYSTAPAAGACKIEVTSVSAQEIEGRFTATLVSTNGTSTYTVTDGYFRRKNTSTGGGSSLPEGETGVSFVVNGQTYRYISAGSNAFEGYAGIVSLPGATSPGYPLGIQIHSVPNTPGTYACGSGPAYRGVNIWFYWNSKFHYAGNRQAASNAGPAGSSCTITVTKVATIGANGYDMKGTFEGTFSGTFVTNDGAGKIVLTDGKFRYIDGK